MGLLDSIQQAIKSMGTGRARFDPSSLNDDVALKTSWLPQKRGGTNMRTHVLKKISESRYEFKVSAMGVIFPLIFIIVGLGVAVGMTVAGLKKDITMVYFGLPFGTIFFLVGFFILRSYMAPRVFDLNKGYYWKGKLEPDYYNINEIKECCPIRDIYALQIISEYCRSSSSNGGSSSYFSYELNLVLDSGERINVVDHGSYRKLADDALMLGRLLNRPVWDATCSAY